MNKSQNEYTKLIEEITNFIIESLHKREDTIGLSIAIVDDKEIIWAEGFGFTDNTREEQVTAKTLFSTQSMGKCFTATAFMIMASKGLVNLDDPIQKYYPKFKINTIFGDPKEEIAKITFRRVLSHTAGFTHEALVGNNYDYSPCTFEEHIQSISKGWLKSLVGSELSYSNLGYDLTGFVMGLIKNKSYQEVMDEELFKPLKITGATYDVVEAQKKSFAKGYEGDYAYPVVPIPMLCAGGLFISALEVGKIISFHLNKGKIGNKQYINPDLFEEMYNPQFNETKEFGYGLGLYSTEKIYNAKVYGHAGGGYGFQTNMMWIPEYNIGVVVLSNNMKESCVRSIARKALELMIVNNEKIESKSNVPKLLKRLVGTYCSNGNLAPQLLRFSYEEKNLFLYLMNGTRIELKSQNQTEFLSKNGIRFLFELNDEKLPIAVNVDDPVFPYKAKLNDSPMDEYGPNQPVWQNYTGIYQFEDESRPNYLALTVINGYLYLIFRDNLKLLYHQNNLYFTVDGEALILKEGELNYKGISATKIDFKMIQFVKEISQNEIKFDFYYMAVSNLVRILHNLRGLKQTLDFMEKIILIDKKFINNFVSFGKQLYAIGELQNAKIYLIKLLEFDSENTEIKEILELIK
ncbi:MAG TPA: serine hydrolase domain-containing protein [Candidatus Bathyarchaeia archaeon]|nr:serine hydrolase domain-containing protein [Candidatus Bathyarchaeia archaeon]